ncbi:hypothetical protein [Paraburkholderia sp.]|nr:hypothetical protein [Paraburkholderia sp.]
MNDPLSLVTQRLFAFVDFTAQTFSVETLRAQIDDLREARSSAAL